MNVLGLDPSLSSYGVAVPGRTFSIVPKVKGVERLALIRRHVVHAARASDADLAVMEFGAIHTYPLAFKAIAEACAVTKLALYDVGVAVAEVNPQTLKLFATGRGNADKAAMSEAARRHAPLERFETSDECDAWWCRMLGLAVCGRLGWRLSERQRSALDRVEVPVSIRRRIASSA